MFDPALVDLTVACVILVVVLGKVAMATHHARHPRRYRRIRVYRVICEEDKAAQ